MEQLLFSDFSISAYFSTSGDIQDANSINITKAKSFFINKSSTIFNVKKNAEGSQVYQVYQLVDTIDPVDGVIIRASCIDYQPSQ